MSYFDNIKTFIRVYELGSMSAAARDQRISPAVASARISQLEEHLSVRLFQRTTRMLHPTEQGKLFYSGATRVLEAVEDAEAAVQDITQNPRGTLYVSPTWHWTAFNRPCDSNVQTTIPIDRHSLTLV